MKSVPDDQRTLNAFELNIVCLPSGTLLLVDEWRHRHPGTDDEFRKSLVSLVEDGFLFVLYQSGTDDWTETLSNYHGVDAAEIRVAFRRS